MAENDRRLWFALVAAFAVWAVLALFDLAGQRKLFYEGGVEELYDFWMPRMCLEQGYIGHPGKYDGWKECRTARPMERDERDVVWSDWYTNGETKLFITGWRDKVYPRFAILPLGLFPATRGGACLWSCVAGGLLLAALCLIGRSSVPLLLVFAMPFLFNLERGNPVWISAACVGVFLAWWDDESDKKRTIAAACLAVAGAMKIAPLALGAIYFAKWRWKPVLFCIVLATVLLIAPWFFGEEGFAAFPVMLRNAREHAEFVLRSSDFGFVQLWRTVRVVLGQAVDAPWPGLLAVARASQAAGFAALFLGAKRRDYVLLVGGMILAAGNMYYYAALYMLPVLVLERVKGSAPRMVDLLLWFALLCPLQLVVLGHSANQVVGNVAILLLMARRTFPVRQGDPLGPKG